MSNDAYEDVELTFDRPMPPDDMPMFKAAPEVYEWLHQTVFNPNHFLYNSEHEHLFDYQVNELAFMWAHEGYEKGGKYILGTCEKPMFMAGGWKRARQIMWFEDMLGELPEILITLNANYCRDCTDLQFAELVEHELYHIIHKTDKYGDPSFRADGKPRLDMVSHDVEEFNGVVRRYGGDDAVIKMVELANKGAELK